MSDEETIDFSDENIVDLVRAELEKVEEVNAKGGEIPMPHLMVAMTENGKDFEDAMFVYEWNNEEAKYASLYATGRMIVEKLEKLPVCVCLVSDSWWVPQEDVQKDAVSEWLRETGNWSPGQDPKRREAILILALTHDGRSCVAWLPYDRVEGRMRFIEDDKNTTLEVKHNVNREEANILFEFYRGASDGSEALSDS